MHRNRKEFEIKATWDPEAKVWYVADSDIPGLCTEAATLDDLTVRIGVMIPELLLANKLESFTGRSVPFRLIGERHGEIEITV